MRKSLLLIAALFAAMSAMAEATLYYVNTTGWSSVMAYIWDGNTDTPVNAWPGENANLESYTSNGYEVYSYTFDETKANKIIFNNGNGGEGNQTADLDVDLSTPYFIDGAWYANITTAIDEVEAEDAVVAVYDLLGRPVATDAKGLIILQYASGKTVKVYNN